MSDGNAGKRHRHLSCTIHTYKVLGAGVPPIHLTNIGGFCCSRVGGLGALSLK